MFIYKNLFSTIKIKSLGVCILLYLCFIITQTHAQEIKIINQSQLQEIIKNVSEEKLVVNFWASWCKPCIKEMTWMDQLPNKDKNFKVIFVSLDSDDFAKKKLPKVLKKLNLQSPTYKLDAVDYTKFNKSLNLFFDDWDGSLPATILVNTKTNKKYFQIGSIEQNSLLNKFYQL